MDFRISRAQADFLNSFRSYLDSIDLSAAVAETMETGWVGSDTGPEGRALLQQLGQAGWLGGQWPAEYGGQDRSEIEQWLFLEEMMYRRVVNGGLTISSIGPTLIRAGSDAQKSAYLPRILSGELEFAVGYTEPNAGSDLASLATRAVREGDEYVVNGQKVFTTAAHTSTHLWLAVRTGPAESRHRGISLLIVPTDTPGVTIRPLITQGGVRTNEVFLVDVRVPVENLVGAENEGWALIVMALDFERLFSCSGLTRDFEDIAAWAASTPLPDQDDGAATVLDDPASRQRLAEMAIDIDVTRLFALRTAWTIEEGRIPTIEASMTKITLSENMQKLSSGALDLMGAAGQIGIDQARAPMNGLMESKYRISTMLKFGAGTNEVQRNIIAQRGLGMPR